MKSTSEERVALRGPGKKRSSWLTMIAVALLLLHAGLLFWSAAMHSPVTVEYSYVPAGLSHWQLGTFELTRVSPPLVRMVATLPLLAAQPETDWELVTDTPGPEADRAVALSFIRLNGERTFDFITLARWACVPFSLLGGWVCWRWAEELYGPLSGLLSLGLWCFSPNILAHGALATADVGASSLGVAAMYSFWHWLRQPSYKRSVFTGIVLGLAELTKTVWILLYVLWPVLWLVYRWRKDRETWGQESRQLLLMLFLGVYMINVAYLFDGTFQKLGEFGFVSNTLGGPAVSRADFERPRNRFRDTWLGDLPMPFPKDYVKGIDVQKSDFDRKLWSYLRGQWQLGGWWYFYLYAAAIKVPIGTWALAALALVTALLRRSASPSWQDRLILLAPPFILFVFVSSQTGFSHHFRYVLPCFPFTFIAISSVARTAVTNLRVVGAMTIVASSASMFSSMLQFPHSLSYFNLLVGGPVHGHDHLLGSNLDWSQDLLYLKSWIEDHPEARPFSLAFHDEVHHVGFKYPWPPRVSRALQSREQRETEITGPEPGWFAVRVNRLRSRSREYAYFLRLKPTDMVGHSIYIYHVTLDDANRIRSELGLPRMELPD